MTVINSFTVPDADLNARFSDYARGLFIQLNSRNSVKKAIKKGELLLNGQKAETGRWIKKGDRIDLVDSGKNPKLYRLDLDVIYEDDYLAVINKPAGIAVNGNRFRTVENALPGNLKPCNAPDKLKWPKPVHRLDSRTSGLLIISKTANAHMNISRQFHDGLIEKIYRAVVKGAPPQSGAITEAVDGRPAMTKYSLIESVPSLKNKTISLLELYPGTGRTHQLRIHLAGIGHPVIGDTLYGIEGDVLLHKGLLLSAVGLHFRHPESGKKLEFNIDEPEKFHSLLDREERRWKKYNNKIIPENTS